jgi:hypothetical protein
MAHAGVYIRSLLAVRVLPIAFSIPVLVSAQQTVLFVTEDGGLDLRRSLGQASNPGMLAHGGQFYKESCRNQAPALASNSASTKSRLTSKGPGPEDFFAAPFDKDVLAAVRQVEGHE